jgi:hypothetical protein
MKGTDNRETCRTYSKLSVPLGLLLGESLSAEGCLD